MLLVADFFNDKKKPQQCQIWAPGDGDQGVFTEKKNDLIQQLRLHAQDVH